MLAAVLESKSFVRAGEALRADPIGRQPRHPAIEDRLGLRLFERTSKMVRLTEAGKEFCEAALPLLTQLEEVRKVCKTFRARCGENSRINADPTFARLFLAPRLGVWRPIRNFNLTWLSATGSATWSPMASTPPFALANRSHLP